MNKLQWFKAVEEPCLKTKTNKQPKKNIICNVIWGREVWKLLL